MLAAAALAAGAFGAAAKPAAAATPCWKQVINDWTQDERIDRTYPLHCYQDAIAHIPEDLRVYSSIVDDIANARQQVVRTGPVVRVPTGLNPARTRSAQKTTEPRRELFKVAFNKIGPRNADSVPLPLLILGGLSLLLVATGAAGLLSRRMRTRRVPAP